MKRTPAVLASVLLAAGCSSGGGSAQGVDYRSAASIAAALDKGGVACQNYTQDTNVIMVREQGSCTHGSVTLNLTTYQDANQQAQVAKAFGSLVSGVVLSGDAWGVNLPDQATADQAQKVLGGSIK
jgi:hypothetical protein